MKTKNPRKKIHRPAIRLQEGPKKLAKVKQKLQVGGSTGLRRATYADVVTAIDELSIPMRKLSALYEAGGGALDEAVHVDPVSGATSVDRDRFRNALEAFSPPLPRGRLGELATNLEVGFLTRHGNLIAPAFMLLEPSLTQQLDVHAWRSIGISPGKDASTATKTFTALFPNAPPAVVAKKNFRRLVREASNELKRLQRFERYLGLRRGALSSPRPNGHTAGAGGEVLPTYASPAVPVPVTPGSWNSGLEGVEAFAKCFADAQWSMAWYGPVVCIDRACADLIQDDLVGSDWESFVLAVFNLSNSVFENVLAGTWFGWVMAVIRTVRFYWAIMIAGNKGSGGVCLHIPGPWTFGVIGPGWGVGR
jgi:hypothetical protein